MFWLHGGGHGGSYDGPRRGRRDGVTPPPSFSARKKSPPLLCVAAADDATLDPGLFRPGILLYPEGKKPYPRASPAGTWRGLACGDCACDSVELGARGGSDAREGCLLGTGDTTTAPRTGDGSTKVDERGAVVVVLEARVVCVGTGHLRVRSHQPLPTPPAVPAHTGRARGDTAAR